MSLAPDRVRVIVALRRAAIARGNAWLQRRIGYGGKPLWWQWTLYLAAALNGRWMAAELERRGGLRREWP